MKKYLNIKTVGIGIIVFLVLCLFLSKTIYSFNMPQITATIPFTGKLSKTETASGVASWNEKENVYVEVAGKIEDIFVKEGESVNEGQPLMRLSFDQDTTQQKIDELQISRQKLQLDIDNLNIKIDKANDDMVAMEAEQSREVSKSQIAYDRAKTLFDVGAVTLSDLETAEYNLNTTIAKYEKNIADLHNTITMYNQDIKAKQLDIKNNDIQLQPYKKLLATNGNITAPASGTAGGITVSKGDSVQANQNVMAIGIGSEFTINCTIPLENSFVALRDEVKLTNSLHSFTGVVDKITPSDKDKTVNITVVGANISVGETFTVTFTKEGERNEKLVPNEAVQQDSNGYFLYKINRRKGVLGNEYYTEKMRIYIGDSDNTNTVILNEIGFFEPVVLSSNKSFEEGDTITLKNAGDFFAKD